MQATCKIRQVAKLKAITYPLHIIGGKMGPAEALKGVVTELRGCPTGTGLLTVYCNCASTV